MFTFTDEQAAKLVPLIKQALGQFGINNLAPGIFTEACGAVFEAISQYVGPDTEMGEPSLIPADGIPENVWTWVKGAQAVNQEDSGFPGFIRT